MKEAIIRLNSDHIKVKGAEYVQDLVRCKDCEWYNADEYSGIYRCCIGLSDARPDDFCSYGEVRDE